MGLVKIKRRTRPNRDYRDKPVSELEGIGETGKRVSKRRMNTD